MTPMPIATPAETDVRPARGRNPDHSPTDASGGFATAFRSLAEDDAKAADAATEATEDAEPGEDTAALDGDPKADPRSALLTLLAPLARPAANTGAVAPAHGAPGGTAAAADAAEGIEADAETRAAALRIAVVRRETHFEPTVHAPMAGEREAAALDRDGAAAEPSKDLSQLLDAHLARPGLAAGAENSSVKAAASIAIDGGAGSARAAALLGVASSIAIAGKPAEKLEGKAAAETETASDGGSAEALGDDRRLERRAGSFSFDAAVSRVSSGSRESERAAPSAGTGPSANGMPSVATQVASTVIDAMPEALRPAAPEAPRPAAAFASAEGGLRLRAGGAALKTLTIQLQPEHLGTLDVTMRLTDGRLALELAADNVETARMLTADRAGLRSLLEKAGFSIEDAAISVVARDVFAASAARAPDQASAQGDRSGTDARRDAQSQAGKGGRGEGGGASRNGHHSKPETAERRPASGSVFL